MKDYNTKLPQLRKQLERKKEIDSLLNERNRKKSRLEKELVVLENNYSKAQSKADKLTKDGIGALLARLAGDNKEQAQQNSASAKLEYDTAIQQLEKVKNDIQKTWNESVSLGDVQRQYDNLMAEIRREISNGNNAVVDSDIWHQELKLYLMDKKQQLEQAVTVGQQTLQLVNDMVVNTCPDRTDELKKQLMEFRNAIGDVSLTGKINMDNSSGNRIRDILPRNQLRYGMSNDLPPLDMKAPISKSEKAEIIGTVGYQVEQIIRQLKDRLAEIETSI